MPDRNDSIVQVWGGPSPDKANLARPKWGMDFRRAPEPEPEPASDSREGRYRAALELIANLPKHFASSADAANEATQIARAALAWRPRYPTKE